MRQPGVEVRLLRQMNGHASFNQVFFTDAEVLPEHLVGELGGGWAVATTTLMHERRGADGTGGGAAQGPAAETQRASIYDGRSAPRPPSPMSLYRWYPQRAGRVDLVLERANTDRQDQRGPGRAGRRSPNCSSLARSAEWTARRARAAQMQGRPQGPEGSLGKLAASHVALAPPPAFTR